MNVRVELDNSCSDCWVPSTASMEAWLGEAYKRLDSTDEPLSVSVRIVGERESARMNATYRGMDRPTNILSFDCSLPAEVVANLASKPIGDLAICAPLVEAEAMSQGKTLEAHWAHLLTHGFLHLNGYDHETEQTAVRMESLEASILKALGFPHPYGIDEEGGV